MWLLILMGCSADPEVLAILELAGDAANGGVLYADTCSDCHGVDGTGGTETGIAHPHSDAKTVRTVLNGKSDMPAFRADFSDQEVADINEHVQTEIYR